MKAIAFSALLAGSIVASHAALAQTQTAPAEPAPPNATPPPATPSTGGATTAPSSPQAGSAQPSTTAPVPPPVPTRRMTVSALTDKNLVGPADNEIGEIDEIVESNADKKQYLVVSRGGFLGFFETEILLPLENVAVQNDRIMARNLTEEQLKALPKFSNEGNAYRELDDAQEVTLTEQK